MPHDHSCPPLEEVFTLLTKASSRILSFVHSFRHNHSVAVETVHQQLDIETHPSAFVPLSFTKYGNHPGAGGFVGDELKNLRKHVMLHGGTEPAFYNAFWNHHENGVYKDFLTGQNLFSSSDKFDSGTGWPSFTKPVNPEALTLSAPDRFGRIEVHTAHGAHHLGHLFPGDGPAGKDRYCINSAALSFQPSHADARAKVASFLALDKEPTAFIEEVGHSKKVLGLAGGCYWGLQQQLDSLPGVIESHVGFMGGPPEEHPTYDSLEALNAEHPGRPWVETVQVTYLDKPGVLGKLLQVFSKHRDGVNHGVRYSREIFGNASQLEAVPLGTGARLIPSKLTRFALSDRAFDQKYLARFM